jgi:5-oxoprolinase (ATP-hydrolysing) subunit C
MIEIVHTAPLLTVQDTGRRSYRHDGVPLCGAMDGPALRRANLLLGNLTHAAALEVTAGPLTLRSHGDHALVWMGTDMQARVRIQKKHASGFESQSVIPGFVTPFPAGAELVAERASIPGQRALIAFAGGIDVPRIMGSRGTDLNNHFGGYQGRSLRAGDRLAIRNHPSVSELIRSVGVRQPQPDFVLRAIPGLDYDNFYVEEREAFWRAPWQVSGNSNRMGLRLRGRPLSVPPDSQRFSSGVLGGMIQMPPDGQPIVLAADAQTTGGYPVIASVIQADLWQLAYLAPGMPVRFTEVSVAEAQGLLAAQRQERRLLALRLQKLRADAEQSIIINSQD